MATGTLKALHFRVPVADGGALRQLNPSFRNGTLAWRDVSHLGSISSSSLGFPPNCWIIRATEGPNQQVECKDNRSRGLAGLSDSVDTITQSKSSLDFAVISFLPQEPVLPVSNKKKNVNEKEEEHDVKVDGGFVVPDSNAFGHSFRDYEKESERNAQVAQFYKTNHINQTYEFAMKKKQEYGKLQKGEMSIWECCELLNEFVDESDPDLDEPQIEHLLQTAEAIRKDYPDQDWLHLTALIHDLGKVLLHPTFGGEPQWCAVGDTFPLGCAFDESIVHHKYFKENPDYQNPVYRTKLGIYKENCGLDKVTMSWGHDEYMYLVAKGNNTTLPPAALFIIRFHSFYPLHRSGAYSYLMNDEDKEMLKWLQIFNKYDLYTKSKVRVNQEEVKPYYLSLIQKYFPAKLRW